jgi:hypothetical protein
MPRRIWRGRVNLRRRLYEILEHGTKKRRSSNGRRVATVVHDAKVNATTGNKPGLPSEARA